MINRLILLKNLPNTKIQNDVQICEQVAQLRSQFSMLAARRCTVKEQMKVAILISFPSEQSFCAPAIASVYILNDDTATWSYMINIFIEETNGLKHRRIRSD